MRRGCAVHPVAVNPLMPPAPAPRRPAAARAVAAIAGDRRGVAALELALVLPLFSLVILGAAQLALAHARARELDGLAVMAAQAVRAHGARLDPDLAVPAFVAGNQDVTSLPPRAAAGAVIWGAVESRPRLFAPDQVGSPPRLENLLVLPADVSGDLQLYTTCAGNLPGGRGGGTSRRCAAGARGPTLARIHLRAPVPALFPNLVPDVSTDLVVSLD
jgi:Flp pilus assembly pilin Flp